MFTQLIAVALAAMPFVAQPVMAADCARSYTVQQGDICDSISAAKNVSTYQLAINNIQQIDSQCTNLVPGETLCLGYKDAEDCKTTYVVKADDDCEAISKSFGLNSTILTLNNPQIDNECGNLYIGEVLCTSKTVEVPVAPSGAAKPVKPTTAKAAKGALATPTSSTPKATSTPSSDDDDVPYCDEL